MGAALGSASKLGDGANTRVAAVHRGTTAAGLIACTAAVLLPVAFSPAVAAPLFMPKFAVLVFVLSASLPFVIRAPLTAARLASLAVLAIAAVSTAMSHRPWLAVMGQYNWGTGFIFVAALVAAWTTGSMLDDRWRWRLESVIFGVIAFSTALAILQSLVDLSPFHLGLYDGRAPGTTGNPVHLGALAAGGVFMGVVTTRPLGRPLAMCAVSATAVALTGGRAPLALALFAIPIAFRRRPTRAAFLLAAAIVVGLGAGTAVAATGRSVTAAERGEGVARLSSGLTPRVETWWSARHAVAERPLAGWGPGQFRAATVEHRTLSVAQYAPDAYYLDAHNIVIEYAVTIGVIGLAAFLAWLWFSFRYSHGPLAAFAAAVLLSHLLQPQGLSTTPLAFLALGATAVRTRVHVVRWRLAAAVAMGVTLAAAVVIAGVLLERAELGPSIDDAKRARRMLPGWPEPSIGIARLYTFDAHPTRNPTASAEALRWYKDAAARDPRSPALWVHLGRFEYSQGLVDDAELHFCRALELDRWSADAMREMARVAEARSQPAAAARWMARAAVVEPFGRTREEAGPEGPASDLRPVED